LDESRSHDQTLDWLLQYPRIHFTPRIDERARVAILNVGSISRQESTSARVAILNFGSCPSALACSRVSPASTAPDAWFSSPIRFFCFTTGQSWSSCLLRPVLLFPVHDSRSIFLLPRARTHEVCFGSRRQCAPRLFQRAQVFTKCSDAGVICFCRRSSVLILYCV
jgi:hypothetical protein